MKKAIVSWTLLVACNLMWALQFTSIKLTQDQAGPYFTVWGPMLLSNIFMLPYVYKAFKKTGIKSTDILLFVQLSLLGGLPAQIFITWGTQNSSASNAAIITLALPVITIFLAFLILKEKMNRIRWFSLIIAIVGVILCSTGDIKEADFSSKYAWGNILIFLSLVASAYYNVKCKRVLERYSEMQIIFSTQTVSVIVLLPLVLYFEPNIFATIPHFTTQTWIGMGILAVFQNFLSMVLFFRALKMLDAMQVALSNYLITFFGLPIAVIWLGEKLSVGAITGGILVFISTLIITIVDYQMSTRKEKMETLILKQP